MSNRNQWRDRFSQYLASRVGNEKAEKMVYSSQESQQQTPIRQSWRGADHSNLSCSASSSINSSAFSLTKTHTSKKMSPSDSKGKTISVKKNRLKKLRDVEQNICAICLDPYHNAANMSCGHTYCYQCLNEWLKTSSRCPYCRSDCPFYVHGNARVEIKRKEFEYSEGQEEEGEFDFECYMCESTSEGDTVMICDRCDIHACHVQCDTALGGRIPDVQEEWFCHFCRR